MDNLKKTNGLVLDLLESNPDTRSSDDYLYSLVCEKSQPPTEWTMTASPIERPCSSGDFSSFRPM